jgi:hypothetical protein
MLAGKQIHGLVINAFIIQRPADLLAVMGDGKLVKLEGHESEPFIERNGMGQA